MKICLSISGGAIRAQEFCTLITEDVSNQLGYSLFDVVDLVVANSAGSIVACQHGLSKSKKLRQELKNMGEYNQHIRTENVESTKKLFKKTRGSLNGFRKPLYNIKTLTKIIDENYDNPLMKDFTVPTAILVDGPDGKGGTQIQLFSSYKNPNLSASKIISASSSFPIGFSGTDISYEENKKANKNLYYDGGITCPNPIMVAFQEAKDVFYKDNKKHSKKEELVFISLTSVKSTRTKPNHNPKSNMFNWYFNGRLYDMAHETLYDMPHQALMQISAECEHITYLPFHFKIEKEHLDKYPKANFSSTNAKKHNIDAFKNTFQDYIQTNDYLCIKQEVIEIIEQRKKQKGLSF